MTYDSRSGTNQSASKHEIVRLNARDSKAFFEALAKPVQFNTALTKALAAHDQAIISK